MHFHHDRRPVERRVVRVEGRTLLSAAFDFAFDYVARAPSPAKLLALGWRSASALRYHFNTHLWDG
ncbi:MAG TPA: hypothetical protein VGN39_19280 [Terriglobales bacterium]|jgi:hypothetical protein|nr:hypothetical protein [Terriglobales bacterium]